MNEETAVRLLSEIVAYEGAFKTTLLVLKESLPLVPASPRARSAALRSRSAIAAVRGELLTMPAGIRDDLQAEANRVLREKLGELLAHVEGLLVVLETDDDA